MKKYEKSIPFFQKIGEHYKDLLYSKYIDQMERARINDFHIPGTPFSTITINRNFRTAVHKDSGDFGGFACLSVLEENKLSHTKIVEIEDKPSKKKTIKKELNIDECLLSDDD